VPGALLLLVTLPGCTTAKASKSTAGTVAGTAATVAGTAATTSTTVGVVAAGCADGSSPAVYNPATGTYAVYLTGIDVGPRTISFDVIQWLTGTEAAAAYHKKNPTDPDGPPNDYFIVDESPRVYTATVASSVDVRLVRLGRSGTTDLKSGTFDELPTYLAASKPAGDPRLSYQPFWLTMHDNAVDRICEQYTP
jgi:uncharacterized protein (DUF779 family)